MLDHTILVKAAERLDPLDEATLRDAHDRSHTVEAATADEVAAHHLVTGELRKRGIPVECALPPMMVSALRVSRDTFMAKADSLPDELVQALRQAFAGEANQATIITSLGPTGYGVSAVPRLDGDTRSDDEVWADLTSGPDAADDGDADSDPDADEDDDDDDDDEDEDEDAPLLTRFFAALSELVGLDPTVTKGYTFHTENAIISRNKRRSIAKQEHDFKAAAYTTRKGVKRCLTCGGKEPAFGKCNMKPSFGMLHMMAKSDGAQTLVYKDDGSDQRFTLAPMYIPNAEDAHGEWTDGDELQQALWAYVRSGDRRIRLQHNKQVVAGEWVEIMSWPFPITVPVQQPDGTTQNVDFPADTTFMGIVWEPWAWTLIKQGKITGLSIGGTAQRVAAPIPTEKSDPGPDAVHVDVPLGSRRKPPTI